MSGGGGDRSRVGDAGGNLPVVAAAAAAAAMASGNPALWGELNRAVHYKSYQQQQQHQQQQAAVAAGWNQHQNMHHQIQGRIEYMCSLLNKLFLSHNCLSGNSFHYL